MAQITVRDLALGYDSHVIADKLNFSVSSGDYLCIVGENGSKDHADEDIAASAATGQRGDPHR